jgi:hypothetical protein
LKGEFAERNDGLIHRSGVIVHLKDVMGCHMITLHGWWFQMFLLAPLGQCDADHLKVALKRDGVVLPIFRNQLIIFACRGIAPGGEKTMEDEQNLFIHLIRAARAGLGLKILHII